MTTRKQPLTILGAPLRRTKYGWTAKTKVGRVRAYECTFGTGSVDMYWSPTDSVVGDYGIGYGSIEAASKELERKLRAIHSAMQVKL